MTNLTEKWRKGELPEGWYYVKDELGLTNTYKYYEGLGFADGVPQEVLAEVPSYEEWQKLLSDQLAKNEGVEINAELEKSVKDLKHRNENLRLALKTYELPEIQKVLTDWRTGGLDRKFNKLEAQNTKLKEELKEICEKYLKIKTTVSAYEDACKDLHAYIKNLKEILTSIRNQCRLHIPRNGLNPVGDRAVLCKTFYDLINQVLGEE